jgi:hypothetical protein
MWVEPGEHDCCVAMLVGLLCGWNLLKCTSLSDQNVEGEPGPCRSLMALKMSEIDRESLFLGCLWH